MEDNIVDIDELFSNVPEDMVEEANAVKAKLLPKKSKDRYDKMYNEFKQWCGIKNVNHINENVLLVYFDEISKTFSSSSLWTKYSMLKSTLLLNDNINIKNYATLIALLKRNNEGYIPKKANVLTKEQMENFIMNAPDEEFLLIKVATIIAICGACRCIELLNLQIDNVKTDENKNIIIGIEETKTKINRSFPIVNKHYIDLIMKYRSLRPASVNNTRFFIKYYKGKCQSQPVGKNKFGLMGMRIATFLNLPNPETYTGHTFRRSSATMLANAGASMTTLKRHGGWRSSSVAEGYIENSIGNKIRVAQQVFTSETRSTVLLQPGPSTRELNASTFQAPCSSGNEGNARTINIQNCSNCTFNFN